MLLESQLIWTSFIHHITLTEQHQYKHFKNIFCYLKFNFNLKQYNINIPQPDWDYNLNSFWDEEIFQYQTNTISQLLPD